MADKQKDRISRHVATSGLIALQLRLGALCLTAASVPMLSQGRTIVAAAQAVAALASFLLVLRWDSTGQRILTHPVYLAGEIFLTGLILSIAGPQSPFVYFSLFTALFGGLFYSRGRAGLLGAALLAGYYAALQIHASDSSTGPAASETFHDLIVLPALIPLAAVAGVIIRELLERQALTDHRLSLVASEAAAERERNRLARNLHDSFAKTLQGIAMSAEALAVTSERTPERAGTMARTLADGARTASTEARSIRNSLRATVDLESPLHEALGEEIRSWSRRAPEIEVSSNLAPTPAVDPLVGQEVLLVAREALRNVARHSHADLVEVSLSSNDCQVTVTVRDNGGGFEWYGAATEDQYVGHFGLVGMRERMETVGGALHIHSVPGEGTTLTALIPVGALNDSTRLDSPPIQLRA